MALHHRVLPFALAAGAVASSLWATGAAEAGVVAPTLLLPNMTISEGNKGTGVFEVNVALSDPNPFENPVTVEVVDYTGLPLPGGRGVYGSATPGSDYVAFGSFDLTFEPGQQVATFPVRLKGDRVVEGDEEIDVRFDDTQLTVGDNDVDLVLANDDGVSLTKKPLLLAPNQDVPEPDSGCFPYRVSMMLDRPAPTRRTVDAVDFTSVPLPPPLTGTYGTATPGVDYLSFGVRTLAFAQGRRATVLPVTICGDTAAEGLEQVDVRFVNTTSIAVRDNDIDLMLSDDD